MAGLLDTPKRIYKSLLDAVASGAEMYGSASQPTPPEVVKGVLGFTPVAGDAISAYDAYDAAKQGNYGEAALNAVGLLPFVPSLGGIVRNKALEQSALEHFGKTFNPKETGFILDDGSRLDLSGRHYASGYSLQGGKYIPDPGKPDYLRGDRAVDHRELDDLVPGDGWEGLSEFLNQAGAVRYMPGTGISVVDTNMPSRLQIEKAVTDFRRNGDTMYVDVDSLNGNSRVSKEFEKPSVDLVLNFLKKNMKPGADK